MENNGLELPGPNELELIRRTEELKARGVKNFHISKAPAWNDLNREERSEQILKLYDILDHEF
jgi:hypothetical protein